jgi:site-specific DNA recombinase
MKNIAIYVRVSTLDQSYDRQISDIKSYINHKYNGASVNIDVYNEKISGYKNSNKRPQLDKLTSKIKDDVNYYSCIYVTELSRLGRNPLETRFLVNDLLNKKIDICVTTSNGGTYFLNPDGSINEIQLTVFGLLMDFADIEAKQFKSRSKSGMRHSISQGGASGGLFQPYGYTKDENKKLIKDEVEAEVIRGIFNDYKSGLGVRVIANNLNEKNTPTRTNKAFANKEVWGKASEQVMWTGNQIHTILKNTIYKGVRIYKKRDAELTETFNFPNYDIVSKELFDQCEVIRLNKNIHRERNYHTRHTILLQYLLKCAVCGRNYTHKICTASKIYLCSCQVTNLYKSCGNLAINVNLLDSAIYDTLCKTNNILNYLSDTEKIKADVKSKIKMLELSLPLLQKDLTKIENRIKRLVTDYYDDRIGIELYESNLSNWETEKNNLSTQIETQSKQLSSNKETLINLAKPATNQRILIDAKNDRNKLQSIFKQIIKKITITSISLHLTRCDIKIQLNGEELPQTLIIICNRKALKYQKIYQYKSFLIEEYESLGEDRQDYYDDYMDNEKYLNISDWENITDNQIILNS